MPRRGRVGSIANELLHKSREAALSAVQIFNNPLIQFKSETYIVLMIIAWTYLLHAYYRKNNIEYRYYNKREKRRRFDRTKHGSFKYWELERCLNDRESPIDRPTASNLRFLIGLRHEIEHEMSTSLDDYLGGRYQACALNYNRCAKELFGEKFGIEKYLTHSIQFLPISLEQLDRSVDEGLTEISSEVWDYIFEFDSSLGDEELSSDRYSFSLIFTKKNVNHPGQADRAIEFVSPEADLAEAINTQYWVKKEVERPKYLPSQIVKQMNDLGYVKFRIYEHTKLWKSLDAKKSAYGYCIDLGGRCFWYESWVEVVKMHCQDNQVRYKENGITR